jgi:SAM-dependent methyltransferase
MRIEKCEGSYPLYFVVLLASLVAAFLAYVKKPLCRSLNIQPSCNSELFDGAGPKCREVKEGAKGWKALHVLYNGPFEHPVDRFWLLGLKNPRAVRNRLRVVVSKLSEEIERVLERKGSVTIVSLACGSAEAVVQAISSLGDRKSQVRLILLDMADDALDYARGECERAGIDVTTVQSDIMRLIISVHGKHRSPKLAVVTDLVGQVDIVEMVGLLDYLNNDRAQDLFFAIRELLAPGGMFITANVIPNPEIPFLRLCSDWEMIYRLERGLHALCSTVFLTVTTVEPLGVHAIAVCRKV